LSFFSNSCFFCFGQLEKHHTNVVV
jgi:hypothetical protein